MGNYKIMIVFLSLYLFSCLPAEADRLDDFGLRNNDPKLIGKIASLKKRNIGDNKVELAFEIILKNLEDAPKKIIFTYPKRLGMFQALIFLYGYSENQWWHLDTGIRLQTKSLVVPGKSQKKLKFELFISNYVEEELKSLLKLYIGGYKVSPTDWGKSIEIDFWIKPGELHKLKE